MESSGAISNPERWCCESAALNMPAHLENSAVATGLERSVFILIPKKGNAKECSNYCTLARISHASKIMLKILQARLQQYVNCELSDVQAGFKRQRNQRPNCQHLLDHWKSKTAPGKHLLLLYWLCQSLPLWLPLWLSWSCGSISKKSACNVGELGLINGLGRSPGEGNS